MLKIFKTKFNKLTALLTATSLLISFVVGPTAASAINNEQTAKEYSQIFKEFILPYSYGKITKSHFAGTDRVIINIQDLHCHPKVQKNIANIIEIFDKKYGVNNIYLEGAYGDVSTNWITDQMKKDKNLLEKMLDTGRLTGAEYYSALSGNTEIIKGLEEKEPYLDNIARLGSILDSQEKIDLILKSLDESVNEVKKQYYSKRQYKLERLFEDYKQGKITSQKYYTLLSKHIDKLGIDLTKYENTLIYVTLLNSQKDLNYKQITKELQSLIAVLKQQLPYNAYKSLLENTSNFQEVEKLYSYIIQLDKVYNLDISLKFTELDKYFKYVELSKKINPVELVKEDEFLSQEINTRFSQIPAQKDVVFLVHFGRYLKDYVTTKITLEDYKYYKENIEQYRKIYKKYVDNRVLSVLDEYIAQIDKFYEINMDRNFYFTKNMFEENEQFVQIEQVKQSFDDINKIISNMDEVKRVDVVVTGGFHSQTVTELLEQQNVSYIVITPNVTDGIKLAEETYYELAKEQSKISFQTIAPVIASLSPQLQSVLLSKIESKNTEKIEQIMKKDESEIAQTIADLAAAKLLESDDLGNIEEVLNEIVKNLVDEYHKEKVTPELVSEIKNLQSLLKNKENLQKVIDLLSVGTAKQSVMLVSDMFDDIYEQLFGILPSFADKDKLEPREAKFSRENFDDIEKEDFDDGSFYESYFEDEFDSLELWFSDSELVRLSREIIEKGNFNEDIENFIWYLGIHNIADYELLDKILATLRSMNNDDERKKWFCGVLYALIDKDKSKSEREQALKTKEKILSFLETPKQLQFEICDLFSVVDLDYNNNTKKTFFDALLDVVNEGGYKSRDIEFLFEVVDSSRLIAELGTRENLYDFLSLSIEKRKLLYDFYKSSENNFDIGVNQLTLNFIISVLNKYNFTDEQFNYIMELICSINLKDDKAGKEYIDNLKEKEINSLVLDQFKYLRIYNRYMINLLFSDIDRKNIQIIISNLQKIIELFDGLQKYQIDTLETENKGFALFLFSSAKFKEYCETNKITDITKQYQLAIRISRRIHSITGDKFFTLSYTKTERIIERTLKYYDIIKNIISLLTLFTNKTAVFSLHNGERNDDGSGFRFTPAGLKKVLEMLDIKPEVFEVIEISFLDKVLDFINGIEQEEIDTQTLLNFVNSLDGSVIVKNGIIEDLSHEKKISKNEFIKHLNSLKSTEYFVEVNRLLRIIEHFNDYKQEKGVFVFDGHGHDESFSYSENGALSVKQISKALINAYNNGVALGNITLMFESCHSYDFADNIINELKANGITTFPQIITDAGRETVYGYTNNIDIDGTTIRVSNLFYSLLKFLKLKTEEELKQMKGRLTFKDVADAPRYLSNNTMFVTNQQVIEENSKLETDILDIMNEQNIGDIETATAKNDIAYAGTYKVYSEMMLPSTQKALNDIGNIGIIKAVYKEKSGENFKFTTLGVALGVLIETFSFWSPNFIKAHNFDPSIQAGMTAVVWVVRALSIGIGIWTGSIPALFLAETITHFVWNSVVILLGKQHLMLMLNKNSVETYLKDKGLDTKKIDNLEEQMEFLLNILRGELDVYVNYRSFQYFSLTKETRKHIFDLLQDSNVDRFFFGRFIYAMEMAEENGFTDNEIIELIKFLKNHQELSFFVGDETDKSFFYKTVVTLKEKNFNITEDVYLQIMFLSPLKNTSAIVNFFNLKEETRQAIYDIFKDNDYFKYFANNIIWLVEKLETDNFSKEMIGKILQIAANVTDTTVLRNRQKIELLIKMADWLIHENYDIGDSKYIQFIVSCLSDFDNPSVDIETLLQKNSEELNGLFDKLFGHFEIEFENKKEVITIMVKKDDKQYSINFYVESGDVILFSIDNDIVYYLERYKRYGPRELFSFIGIGIHPSKNKLTVVTSDKATDVKFVKHTDDGKVVSSSQNQVVVESENEQALVDGTHSEGIERIFLDKLPENGDGISDSIGKNKLFAIYPVSQSYDIDSLTDEELVVLFRTINQNIFQLAQKFPKIDFYARATKENRFDFVMREFVKNAFVHGNLSDPSKPIYIKFDGDKITVYNAVTDDADTTVSKENRERRLKLSTIAELSGVHKGISNIRDLEKDGLITVEQESELRIGTKKYFAISVEKTSSKKTSSLLMLPFTQRTLNKIGNIGIIKAVYKEKSGENFKFTTLGVALGVLIETFSFWSPNFIKAHNFDPSVQAGMTAVVWAVRALSIGIGFATGTIWAIFLTETITHFIWNMAVILIGRQDLLLQTSKTEEITTSKQQSISQQKWTMSNISKEAPYTEKYKLVYYIFEKTCRQMDIEFPEEQEFIIINNIIDAYDSSFWEIMDFDNWVYEHFITDIIDFQQKQSRLTDALSKCFPDDIEDILWIFSQCLSKSKVPMFILNNIIDVANDLEKTNNIHFSEEVYAVLNILKRYNTSETEQILVNIGLIKVPNALYKKAMDDKQFKQLEESIRENEDRKMIIVSEMMLPSTQKALNDIGNIGIIKAVYKEKSGENFRFTTLGVALGVLIETFSFWSPNFIKAHNFDPSIQAGMTAVVWAVRALSIGIGFATGTIWAIFLTETITHFIWNTAVILIGRQDLLLQTSKNEEITIPKQEAKEETGRDFSQEEIDKFEHHLQTTTLQKDVQYQYQPNPALKKNVEEIFGNLLDAMAAQGKITAEERQQYRIHYYFSPVANAYTVTNSKDVFIFSELLYELAEEMHKEGKELTKDHIAAILAHELQHTTQKNRVYTDYKATKGDDKRKEYDADRESIFILEQAGYNPRAVEEIMSALIPLSRTDALSAFFDAHPNTEDRLKEISEILEDPSLVFLSMTATQQPLNLSSLQKYGQDFQEYLNANFDKGTSRVYSLDEKSLQKILDETDFFEKMSIFDISKYIDNNKNFIINMVLNGNYKFFTKAENDFIKSCSAEEKEFIYSLLFATSASFFYRDTDDDNNIIKNLENAQKTRLFDFCINVLDPTKIKNDDILFNMVATMNPTQATLKAFLDFRKINNIIISSYTKENAYFYLTNYKYLTEREISSLLEELIKKNDDIFSFSFESDSDSDFNMSDYSLSDIFESFSQEQKNESLKLILTILTENKELFFMCKDPVGFMNSVLNSDVLTKQEKLEYLLKLSKHMEKHKSRLGYELLDLFDELNFDKTDFEKLVHLFEVLNASENNYYLAQIFSYSELISRYKIFEHDFDAEELKNFAFAIKNFTVKFDIFFLGYFLKLKNPNVKFYFTTQFESYFDKKYSDGICLYPEIDVEKLDRNLLKDITLDDLIEFQNFMMDNHYYCHNISLLANFVADNILNLNAAEKVKIKKLLTLLPKGENHISIKGNVSAIPYEHLKNLVDMQIFYKDIDEQTREVPKSETETSFIAFYVPFLEFRTFNPDYYAVSFEQMVENIKNHFDAYDYLRELEKEDQDKLEIYYSEGIEKMGNPNVPEERIRNMEIEKAWLVELHKIFSLSPEERKVEFNYGEETLVYTYFEINEQLFNNVNLVPTAQQAQQLVNAFSIIKKELPQEMVDVYAKLVYSLLKRNSNLSVFSSAKNNLELLDLLFEDFSVVKDDYITELLDSYDVTVEEYKEIISKTRLYFFSLNSEDNNKNVSSMEIINTILPTMSDSEKIKFFFWLLSGNDSYKPQMLKQVKISNFKYEGEINFDSLQQSFRLMTKTERENFIRRILLGKSGILEKGKASAERNGKEFEQGLKNVLFDDFFLSSLGSSKIKASSISIVFKEVFSIVFNNLSDERKVLFVNNLISALAEIKSSDEKDGDEQKARQLGRLIVALGTSSGVAVVKLLQILSNNKIFEALDDKYGSVINEEVAKVKDENEPLSKSVLFQYLEKLGLSVVIDYVGKRLGSASIGLTYLLKLKNIKDLLVAKVKRPNINKTYDEDFKIAEKLIEYFKSSRSLLDDIYKKTLPEASTLKSLFDRELNFEEEAENLDDFSEQLKNRNSKIRVPQLIKVINGTTVYNQNLFLQTTAKGTTLDKIKASKKQKSRIYSEVLKEFFTEIFVDPIENGQALYHADLHTGNIFVDENGTISFIDLGGVGKVSAQQSKALKDIFMFLYAGKYNDFINALKSYNSKLYEDLEHEKALNKIEEILNRKTSLESKFVDLFEIFNSLENIDSDFMMFIQAISKISGYLDKLDKKDQLTLLNNLSFDRNIQFKIIADNILTYIVSAFKKIQFNKKQQEESQKITQEDIFREKLLSIYPDMSSEDIDLLLSLDPVVLEYIKNNTFNLTQQQLIMCGPLADKLYKGKIITEQNNKMNLLFKIASTTTFSEKNIEKLLVLDENTIEKIISEITEDEKIEILFAKAEQFNIALVYKNDDFFSGNKNFERALMFAKGDKLNKSQSMMHFIDADSELIKAKILFGVLPAILTEELLRNDMKLNSLYYIVKDINLSLEEDGDAIEILALLTETEIDNIKSELRTLSYSSNKNVKRFLFLYKDYRDIFSKKGESTTLAAFVTNNQNDGQIREFFDLAVKNNSIETIKSISDTDISLDISLSSEFALKLILFRSKALGIPIDKNDSNFSDMIEILKNISSTGKERILNLDEDTYTKLFSIKNNETLIGLLKHISKYSYYDRRDFEYLLNEALLAETKDTSSVEQQQIPEEFVNLTDDYNQFEHMENLPDFAETKTEEEKRQNAVEFFNDQIESIASQSYQFAFMGNTKYLYLLQNRKNKDSLLNIVSNANINLKFRLLALLYLDKLGSKDLTPAENANIESYEKEIVKELKKQIENNEFKVLNNLDLRAYMMGVYLILRDLAHRKKVPYLIDNALIINFSDGVMAKDNGLFAEVDLFIVIHELTHRMFDKPKNGYQLVDDALDELVSYIVPNVFLRKIIKLSFDAYSQRQKRYTIHQTNGVIDYVNMGVKFRSLYSMFDEKANEYEIEQEVHSGPLAFLDYLFKAHQKIGKPVNWDALLDVISYLRISRMDQLQVFREILNMYFIYTTEDNLLTKEDTEKIKKEIEKMQTWTILVREILELIESVSPDTFNLLKGRDTPSDYKNEILSKTNKAKESFEEISRAYQMKYQFSKNDLTVMLILDVLKNVEYEQLENNFDGVIAGIIDVINNAAENYSIDLNKQTFDRSDYLKLSSFVKSSFVVAENKGTSIKDNIIAYISKNLGQVLFVEPMINKIFGTKNLRYVFGNKKVLVTRSAEQTDRLNKILNENNINNTTVVTMEIVKSPTTDIRDGIYLDVTKGIKAKYDEDTNTITVYSKKGIADTENIEELIMRQYFSERNEDSFNDVIAFANVNDSSMQDITERLNNAYTDSVSIPGKETNFDLSSRTIKNLKTMCNQEFVSTDIKTFIITSKQAKDFAKDITSLQKQGFKFIVSCKIDDITDITNYDGLIIDDSATDYEDISQLLTLMEKVKKQVLTQGVAKQVYVKFSNPTYQQFNSMNINIFDTYGIVPIVLNSYMVNSIIGKCAVEKITEETIDRLMRQNNIVGLVVDDARIFSGRKNKLRETNTKEEKYNKGYNASLSSKFDYTCNDVKLLADYLTIDITDDNALKELDKLVENLHNDSSELYSSLSLDSRAYLGYLAGKGRYEEMLGFIRGIAMNSARTQIIKGLNAKEINLDMDKFAKEAGGKYQKAFLTVAVQLMMEDIDIIELLETDFIDSDMTVKQYLDSIYEKVNINIEDILKQNEFKIERAKDTAKTVEDFKNYVVLLDNLKIIKETTANFNMSMKAVRGILSAA